MTDEIILPPKVVDIRKCRMCYKFLRMSVVGMLSPVFLALLLMLLGVDTNMQSLLGSVLLLILGFSWLLYLVLIAALAAENHKNPVWWFLMSMIVPPFGTIISFILIRGLGNKNGWLKDKKRRFQRAKG